jgi:protein-tyrosine phosphatase
MAEALLRHRAAQLTLDLRTSSAGLMYDGAPASAGAVEAMKRRGIDLSGHASRVVHPGILAGADLVLCMARMHLREAIVMDRECFGRTFTVKEFVRRAEAAGPRGAEPFTDWLARVGGGRTPSELLGDDPADEVRDPLGRSSRFYRRTADELAALVDQVAWFVGAVVPAPAPADAESG